MCPTCGQPVWEDRKTGAMLDGTGMKTAAHKCSRKAPEVLTTIPFVSDEELLSITTGKICDSLAAHEPNPYLHDPVGWVKATLNEHLWSKQVEIMESVRDNRYTCVPSCHGAGKSFLASRTVSWWIDVHQPGTAFAVSTAPTAAQVEAVLWREIRRAHRKGHLSGYITQGSVPQWKLGTRQDAEIVAYGRKPADTDADAFQGIHQLYLLVVIDEANGIPKVLWDAVDSLATNENCRVLAIGNPDNPDSHFRAICQPGSGWNKIRIDALKTPNFTEEYVPEGLKDLLVSEEWVRERLLRWGKGSPLWRSKVRGEFPDITSDTMIAPSWIEAAQMRHGTMKRRGVRGQLGCDIARFGDDESVIYRNRDGRIDLIGAWNKQDTMTTTGHIVRYQKQMEGLPAVVDEVGIGAGVVDRLRELGQEVLGFNGGHVPFDTEKFVNMNSEAWWRARELFENGEIGIPPEDDILAGQLLNRKWSVTSNGKIKVESKEDYRKRTHASSPDRADACIYALVPFGSSGSLMINEQPAETITGDLMTKVW